MNIAVLPTGFTEWRGLPVALGRLFPNHHFYAIPTEEEARAYSRRFPLRGFTFTVLDERHVQWPPEAALELVERAAQAALGDPKGGLPAADIVLVIDDSELENQQQPERIMAVMRAAVRQHLAGVQTKHRRATATALRDKVSFHLAVPMVEAWFFADHRKTTLRVAGVPSGAEVVFPTDPEDFETTQAAYLNATARDCPCWQALPQEQRKQRPKWLGAGPRQRHPKGYLQWLALDSEAPNCTHYDEGRNGANALGQLPWRRVLNAHPNGLRFLRSMVEDLATTLGPPDADLRPGRTSPVTSNGPRSRNTTLRND